MSSESDLFDQWFRIADTDRDGRVSGAEAVAFFQRSKLPQETLFKIWKLVAGDAPVLTKPQFWASLRLVSLAQQHQGALPEAQARSTLIGVGPALPPPLLLGLEVKGAGPSAAAAPASASAAFSAAYPPLQEHTQQQYLHLFTQLDTDRDGVVQGSECFGTFMQWGLPRQVLKDVWQAVAGDASSLGQQQFVACLYLMELAKQGRPVPAALPPGPFPPGFRPPRAQPPPQQPASPQSFTLGAVQQAQHDVFANDLPAPQLPARVAFKAPPPKAAPSGVPQLPAGDLVSLDPLQRQRLQNDAAAAAATEAELRKAEQTAADAAAREALFRQALQELTLFKSRSSAALLQAQEQAAAARSEADEMEARYRATWEEAQASQSRSTQLLEQLSQAKARKAEARTKLEELHRDISALASITDDQVDAERRAVAELLQEVAAAEAERERLRLQKEALLAGRGSLQEELAALRAELEGGEATIETTEKELASLVEQLEGGDDGAAIRLQACLRRAGALQRRLLAHARRQQIAVPELEEEEQEEGEGEATAETFLWPRFIAAGARDWDGQLEGPDVVAKLASSERLLDPNATAPKPEPEPESAGEMDAAPAEAGEQAWAAF